MIEKDKAYLEDKCKKYVKDLDELKRLRGIKDKLDEDIAKLTHEKTKLEAKDNYNHIELQRLRSIESDLKNMTDLNLKKEDTILELINDKSQLDAQLIELNEKYKNKKSELEDKIEQMTYDNAIFQSQINLLNANIGKLKEEHSLIIDDANKKLNDGECKMNDLSIQISSLKESNNGLINKLGSVEVDFQVCKSQKDNLENESKLLKEKLSKGQQEFRVLRDDSNNEIKKLSQKVGIFFSDKKIFLNFLFTKNHFCSIKDW